MKAIPVLCALGCALLLISCKKDDPTTPGTDPNLEVVRQLTGMIYQNPGYLPLSIEYDAQKRIKKVIDGEDVRTIEYIGNQVKVREFRTSENREVYNVTGTLDNQGKIVSASGISNYNANLLYNVQYTFEYNAEGYMTRKVQDYNSGQILYDYRYTYTSGNLTKQEAYLNGTLDYSGEWEYYPNYEDKWKINWEQFYASNTFTGKSNKNLASKYTGYRDGVESWHVNFTYTFDQEGYPTEGTSTYSNGNVVKIKYQY